MPKAWGHRAGAPLAQVKERYWHRPLVYENPFPFLLGRQQDCIFQVSLVLGVTLWVLASELFVKKWDMPLPDLTHTLIGYISKFSFPWELCFTDDLPCLHFLNQLVKQNPLTPWQIEFGERNTLLLHDTTEFSEPSCYSS